MPSRVIVIISDLMKAEGQIIIWSNRLIELKKITEEVMEDFIKDDPMAQRVYKSYTEFKEQVINYHRISEKAYIDTRELD